MRCQSAAGSKFSFSFSRGYNLSAFSIAGGLTGMLSISPTFQDGVKGSDLKMGIFLAGAPRPLGREGSNGDEFICDTDSINVSDPKFIATRKRAGQKAFPSRRTGDGISIGVLIF
jgi:hypothetical protein